MFKELLENVRKLSPIVHNITNYVTINDCANITLACGASPIMTDDINEAEDITSICSSLNINIGTMGAAIPAMFKAAKKSNQLGHPVVLDPVGAGASPLRTNTVHDLLDEIQFTVIRGNISEIKAIAGGSRSTKGVDANADDEITADNLDSAAAYIKEFAKKTNSVIAVTGAIDIVADSQTAYCIFNGNPIMSAVTGTGCQLSAMTAAFVGANPDKPLEAAAASVIAMGLCGEIAAKRMTALDGNSSYRNYIIDAVYNLDGATLEEGAKYEIR